MHGAEIIPIQIINYSSSRGLILHNWSTRSMTSRNWKDVNMALVQSCIIWNVAFWASRSQWMVLCAHYRGTTQIQRQSRHDVILNRCANLIIYECQRKNLLVWKLISKDGKASVQKPCFDSKSMLQASTREKERNRERKKKQLKPISEGRTETMRELKKGFQM